MNKGFLTKLLLFLTFLTTVSPANPIISYTDCFHSQYCNLGTNTIGTYTYPCTTSSPQTGIIRTALAYIQFAKPIVVPFRQQLSVSYTADPATQFNIRLIYQNPGAGITRIIFELPHNLFPRGRTLIVIKTQTTDLFIDLVNYSNNFSYSDIPGGTSLDNNNNVPKSDSKQFDISQVTIFTGGTAGLIAIPFVSWFKLMGPAGPGYFSDPALTINLQISTTFSDPLLNVRIDFANLIKVQGFGGFILLFNPSQVPVGVSKGWNINYLIVPYQMGTAFSISAVASNYGPSFSPKCILGFYKFSFKGQYNWQYVLTKNPNGNYSGYSESKNTPISQAGNLFCFGNSTECGEGFTHLDLIENKCYISTTCPLPVFTGWTSTNLCPTCTQLICDQCDPSDRSKCSICKPDTNSHLNGTTCFCDTNYIEVTVPIDTASLGLWNNLTPSLQSCKLNCSAVITGCQQNDCQNASFCTVCSAASNYVLVVLSATDQTCVLCNVQIPRCTTCVSSSSCSLCADGSYLLVSGVTSSCPLCSSVLLNCQNCTDSVTCTSCNPGYLLNTTTKQCYCDLTYNNLLKCQNCTVADKCDLCVALYFLNLTTFRCQPCSDIHPSCTDCSDQNTCTSCSAGFALDSVAKPGSVTCRECGKFINNCTLCSSSAICTDCDYFYGLNGSSCQFCNLLLMPGCEACEDASICLKCDSQTRMISNICHYCNEVLHCADCNVSPFNILWCTVCNAGYFVASSLITGVPECKPCQNVCSFCKDCSGPTQCTLCLSPYLLGPTGLCDQCETGYEFAGGFCLNQAGCTSPITRDGKEICLACASQLHFVFDTKQMKCVCDVGYAEFHQIGRLMKCVPVCGDGIVLPVDEDCDDKNTENDDGCDSNCHFQSGFDCAPGQPTSCVLLHIVDTFEYNYVLRVVPKNKATFSFKIAPSVRAFQKLKWEKMMNLQFFSENAVKKPEVTFAYSLQNGELLVTVPYYEELENTIIQASLKLDPTVIKSSKRQYFLDGTIINGKNAPLIFDSESIQSTSENVQTISMILIVILLVQFYLGSYMHKMIGLETIQTIQTLYFSRMIVSSTSTSLLQSMNNIQYSATGYQNADLIFGKSLTEMTQSESYDNMSPEFTSINLQKHFLLNINFSLVPVVIVMVVFMVRLRQKISSRNLFMQTKDPEMMDKYTAARRSCQWVYDHLVFPFIMMFNMACFFENVLGFTSTTSPTESPESKDLEVVSFPTQMVMLLGTLAIYCFEVFVSYEDFRQYRMSQKERERVCQSAVEKLEHDQNYPDRANYHPLYVLVYSLYYLLLQLSLVLGVMFKDFQYSLELVLGVTGAYFLLICFWSPYHNSINAHNHFLKLNHGSVVIFLSICYVFAKVENLSTGFYITSMYSILTLIGCVISGGFIRIWIEKRFRQSLESDNSLLKTPSNENNSKQQNKQKIEQKPLLPKNYGLVEKNPYYFPNQLKQLSKKYGIKQKIQGNSDKLTLEEEICVIEKIREQNNLLKAKNFIENAIQNNDSLFANERQKFNISSQQKQQSSLKGIQNQLNPDRKAYLNMNLKTPKNMKPMFADNLPKFQIQSSQIVVPTDSVPENPVDQKQILRRLKNKMRHELKTMFV